MRIQLTNSKALKLLHELEELHLIKVLNKNVTPLEKKISDKYKGTISKRAAKISRNTSKKCGGKCSIELTVLNCYKL